MLHGDTSGLPRAHVAGEGGGGGGNTATDDFEALACVACRSRKLKCDRTKPACSRCVKLKADCAYPESRRKPAFKRRNVRELEERLAQVEVLLKDAAAVKAGSGAAPEANAYQASPGQSARRRPDEGPNIPTSHAGSNGPAVFPSLGTGSDGSPNWDFDAQATDESPPANAGVPCEIPDMRFQARAENAGATCYELLGLGLFEALPPTEMIEELHRSYFQKQHPLIPILHPGRYMQAFYSPPPLRPPMALQYAVWTMATLGSEKYSQYHDAFHRRCRHYLEEDELKGDGEHFLTVAHAQAWALTATAEARNMWFTRAAMSGARCIKLLHMMGLHRLDDPNAEYEMMPTILPPRDWVELEERRRVFWGIFAIDCHASISTGWPTLIDANEVTTHLPSSEEAFNQGREEKTSRLHEAFAGATYSSFAATAVICHVFNRVMKHANRSQPDDCPSDFEYGKYWNRHRELDNLLSGAFMFLPELFRLPQNVRDPVAVYTNLNLHAATICLHNSAFEIANEQNLPDSLKKITRTRVLSASSEVVNIVRLTSHNNAGFRSPFVALALYVACSVFTSQAHEEGLTPIHVSNIEFLFSAMDAIGKQHRITHALLRQAVLELQAAGLDYGVRVPKFASQMPATGGETAPCGQVPLFARSRVSKRTTGIQPPLPGRLPLHMPTTKSTDGRVASGREFGHGQTGGSETTWTPNCRPSASSAAGAPPEPGTRNGAHKRRRVNLSPDAASLRAGDDSLSAWRHSEPVEEVSAADKTPGRWTGAQGGGSTVHLPHRGGSSTSASSPATAMNSSSTPSSSSVASPGQMAAMASQRGSASVFGATPGVVQAEMDMFQGLSGWDGAQHGDEHASAAFAEVSAAMLNDNSWMVMNDVGGVNGQAWDTDTGGSGVG